ncbi:MAG TPA: helix-turn-helix domain-containing protein [Vicinamibacteria bacterium]|nr:helix-turn-helix domain-containing protein [Vicinamibacteria bacterium]
MAQTLPMSEALPMTPRTLKTLVDDYERQLILEALRASGGQQRRAAASLGVLPSTLHEKMSRLGIPTARTYRP